MAETRELPLFPLNTVLFPGGPLPLRIFEQRYVDMVRHCMRQQSGFGVLLLVLRLLCGAAWAAHGVFTLLAILFVFVGLQFIGLGLIGEYLGRVYHDVRARPRYHIDRITGRKPAENAP